MRRRWPWLLAVVLTVVGVLITVLLAPFALVERPTSGPVADTGATLTGQAQAASEGLRRIGYNCSDSNRSTGLLKRACIRVWMLKSSRVEMVLAEDTGTIRRVNTMVNDEEHAAHASHREVLGVLADALGFEPADRGAVQAAAAGNAAQSLKLQWGTFTVPTGGYSSDLRASNWKRALPLSKTTLSASVDALAAAATKRGYVCTTPQINTIRDCTRSQGGYAYDLWMQGTNTYVTAVNLEVNSDYHTQTRRHWIDEMTTALNWVDTDQSRALSTWLARSADAPGANSYVNGLSSGFAVRDHEYGKETMGGITAECVRIIDNITACAP